MRSARWLFVGIITLFACSTYSAASVERADVPMRDAAGTDLGTLTITNGAGGLLLSGSLRGLPPGIHGIHVHAVGQCQPPFASALVLHACTLIQSTSTRTSGAPISTRRDRC